MYRWVDVAKRKFFALLVALIVVEVVVVVLIARAEHDRFPPLPAGGVERSTAVGQLRSALAARPRAGST